MAGQMGPGILSSGLLSPTGLLWRKGRHLSARKWNLVPRSARRYEIDRSLARPVTEPGFLCGCSADRHLQSGSCRKRFGADALLLHRYRSLRRLPRDRRRYPPAASRLPAKARFPQNIWRGIRPSRTERKISHGYRFGLRYMDSGSQTVRVPPLDGR